MCVYNNIQTIYFSIMAFQHNEIYVHSVDRTFCNLVEFSGYHLFAMHNTLVFFVAVKEAGKDATYGVVIISGITALGMFLLCTFLFSGLYMYIICMLCVI